MIIDQLSNLLISVCVLRYYEYSILYFTVHCTVYVH